jgi:hypothetical protein
MACVFALAWHHARMLTATDRWLGDWVEHALDVDCPETLRVTRACDASPCIEAGGFAYLPHPLRDDLWYAPGVGSYVLMRDGHLWLSRGACATWIAFCRPGLVELSAPPSPPTVLMTRDALIALLASREMPLRHELNLSEIDGHVRWLWRLWTEPGCERRMFDRAGLFDLRDLTAL